MSAPIPDPPAFSVGDRVQRKGSDYRFPGVVLAVFRKLDGTSVRYAVEDDRGTIFIQSDKSLERRA